jgi:hypothetical protein
MIVARSIDPRPTRWTPARALLAFLAGALLLALVDIVAGTGGVPGVRSLVALLVYAAAASVGVSAAAAYGPGDHMRRIWTLLSLDYGALFLGRLFRAHDLGIPDGPAYAWLVAAATLASNAAGVTGMLFLALTWRRAGLPLPGARWQRVAVGLFLAAATLAVIGPDLLVNARQAAQGDGYSAVMALADVCDIGIFLLSVPLFVAARALSGGALAWPFGLLAANAFGWLVVDGIESYASLLDVPAGAMLAAGGLVRNVTVLLFAAAAVSQRLALRASESDAGPS